MARGVAKVKAMTDWLEPNAECRKLNGIERFYMCHFQLGCYRFSMVFYFG